MENQNFIKTSDLKEWMLKDGVNQPDAYKTIEGERYIDVNLCKSYMRHEPDANHLIAVDDKDISAPEPGAAFEEVILKPTIQKRIPKYARYQMDANAVITNATTGTPIVQEKKGDVMKARLTNDAGERVWVNVTDIHTALFQIDIEEKTTPASKIKEEPKLSKSQEIWFAHVNGEGPKLSASEVAALSDTYVLSHVRNVIKDYTANPDKITKAEKVVKLIAEYKAQNVT